MPMPYRFLTSLVVRHQGNLYLFDAREWAETYNGTPYLSGTANRQLDSCSSGTRAVHIENGGSAKVEEHLSGLC